MSTDSTRPFILAINGSPHGDGNTAKILQFAIDAAREAGAFVQVEHLPLDIPHHTGVRPDLNVPDLFERLEHLPEKGGVRHLIKNMLKIDGLFIGTPTYCSMPSTPVAALLHWMAVTIESPNFPLHGMPVAAFTSFQECGPDGALAGVLIPLQHMKCVPVGRFLRQERGSEFSEENWQNTRHVEVGREMVLHIRRNPRPHNIVPLAAD